GGLPRDGTPRRHQRRHAAIGTELDAAWRRARHRRIQAVMHDLRDRPPPTMEIAVAADQGALEELEKRNLDGRGAGLHGLGRTAGRFNILLLLLAVLPRAVTTDNQREGMT